MWENSKRYIILVALGFVITACGGGGGEQSDTENTASDLDKSALTSYNFDIYTGSTLPAKLTLENASTFLDYLFLDSISNTSSSASFSESPNQNSTSKSSVIAADSIKKCSNGGQIVYTGSLNDDGTGLLDVNYQSCKENFYTIDGIGHIEVINATVISNSVTFNEANYIYEKVTLSSSTSTEILSGVQHSSYISDCNENNIDTFNFVLVNNISGISYKMEDITYTGTVNCINQFKNSISGRLYHSVLGYVDIKTLTQLEYLNQQSQYPDLAGMILLSGDKSNVKYTTDFVKYVESSVINKKLFYGQYEVDKDGDLNFENVFKFSISDLNSSSAVDLRDNDYDGLPNGYELAHNLDPNNNVDALSDNDIDSVSALDEFIYFSDPNNASSLPIIIDLSAYIEQIYSSIPPTLRAGQELTFVVGAKNPNQRFGVTNVVLKVTKPSNTTWTDTGGCTTSSADEITCFVTDILQNFNRGFVFKILSDTPGDIQLSANVSAYNYDSDITNNFATLSATFTEREVDLSFQNDQPFHDVAVVGNSHSFDIHVLKAPADEARNTIVTLTFPAESNILAANYVTYGSPDTYGSCSITTNVVCKLGTLPHHAGSYHATISLQIEGLEEGEYAYSGNIISDAIELDPSDNTLVSDLFIGQSLEPYQTILNSAPEPVDIKLQDGYYVGTLYANGKAINLTSVNGPTNVKINDAGLFSTYSSFQFGPNASISGITFYKSSLNIYRNNNEIKNNIFESSFILSSNVVLNVESNEFKKAPNQLACTGVFIVDNYDSKLTISNNVFNGSGTCGGIVTGSPIITEPVIRNTVITNNIFDDLTTAINTVRHEGGSYEIIQNNIFTNNNTAIQVRNNYISNVTPALPTIRTNNFYSNENDYLYLSIPQSTAGNLTSDPLFVDYINGSYSLQLISLLIDAGSSSYIPVVDFLGNNRVKDGDFDTIPLVDIGAVEN